MDGLANLTSLHTLNLSHNSIAVVTGLSGLSSLHTLNLSHNRLATIQALEQISECKSLCNIDLTNNQLDIGSSQDTEESAETIEILGPELQITVPSKSDDALALLEVFVPLPDLRTLYLKHNPIVSKMERYRKNVIASIKTLVYLDDRPIDEMERASTDAWAEGGIEAEKAEKLRRILERDQNYLDNFEALKLRQQEARERYALQAEQPKLSSFPAPTWQLQGAPSQETDETSQETDETIDWSGIELRHGEEPPVEQLIPTDEPHLSRPLVPTMDAKDPSEAIRELYEFAEQVELDPELSKDGECGLDEFALPSWCSDQVMPPSAADMSARIVAGRSSNLADGWAHVERERRSKQQDSHLAQDSHERVEHLPHPDSDDHAPEQQAANNMEKTTEKQELLPTPDENQVDYIQLLQKVLAQAHVHKDLADLSSVTNLQQENMNPNPTNNLENRKPKFVSKRLLEKLGTRPSTTSSSPVLELSLIHISEPTRLLSISYAVFCLKKKKKTHNKS
eukprot:TRINITY_DN2444_c0_g1_i18.p1 TRINITY_DN2444_c0_g1~~TRINITY_DN2444_c0_g1_i18.p1  ORF type:complete len:510 (+),score=117.40 TRINITY_DN2444_c0_g1_i18:442-1971(+)